MEFPALHTGVLLTYNAMSIAVFGLWYYCRYGGNYRPVLRQTFHPAAIAGIVMLMPGTQYLTTYIMSFVCVALSALDGCIRIPA